MHVGSLAPSTSHPPFLFAGEALHPPLLCALTFAPHLFFAGLALHPPSALRPQLCTPPLFCGLSFAGIKGFPKLKSLNAYLRAKIGADTAENEQHFAEILPTDAFWSLHGPCELSCQALPKLWEKGERGPLGLAVGNAMGRVYPRCNRHFLPMFYKFFRYENFIP